MMERRNMVGLSQPRWVASVTIVRAAACGLEGGKAISCKKSFSYPKWWWQADVLRMGALRAGGGAERRGQKAPDRSSAR